MCLGHQSASPYLITCPVVILGRADGAQTRAKQVGMNSPISVFCHCNGMRRVEAFVPFYSFRLRLPAGSKDLGGAFVLFPRTKQKIHSLTSSQSFIFLLSIPLSLAS